MQILDYGRIDWYYFMSLLLVSLSNFIFQPKVHGGCQNLMQKANSFNYVKIIKKNDYKIHFW